jgi:hypothetical protein
MGGTKIWKEQKEKLDILFWVRKTTIMINKIRIYKVRFFGNEEEIELSQSAGQKLIMYLQQNPTDRFIMLENNLKAVSGIKSVDEELKVVQRLAQKDGTFIDKYEMRELTEEEKATQMLFDKTFNKLLLNKQ